MLDSVSVLLLNDSPVWLSASFPPMIRELRLGIHANAAFHEFKCVELALSTLPNLELLFFWN